MVQYKASVSKDLKRLDKSIARKLIGQLERELGQDPHQGQPLKGEFSGLFKYRIGDYHVVYAKTGENDILVLRIARRKEVYR